MQYKTGKNATKILSLQKSDGSWGCFHTHRKESEIPFTTEYALLRLERFGYTYEDECIKKSVSHMEYLLDSKILPEGNEKSIDFPVFVELILSAWIRRFTKHSSSANLVASKWKNILTNAFESGIYSHDAYVSSFEKEFGTIPRSSRLKDFVCFYQLSLLTDMLDEKTEKLMLDHVIAHPQGVYYVFERRLDFLPDFESKDASSFIAVAELILRYRFGKQKIEYILDWIYANQRADGTWDMGIRAKDGVYFPLSDRWNAANRASDCTFRIRKMLQAASCNQI